MIKQIKRHSSKKTISLPGIGKVSVGPQAVRSTKGESSSQKILESIRKIRKDKIFPPFDHAAA